jgi:hypothetical protein
MDARRWRASSSRQETLRFLFEFSGGYSFRCVLGVKKEARRLDIRIARKPFLVGPIFGALGIENAPSCKRRRVPVCGWIWHAFAESITR